MPVRHEIRACDGLIAVHLSGDVTGAEIFAYFAQLAADPALRPNLTVVADCREVTGVPTFAELGAVADAEPRTPSKLRPTHAAVLVSTPWLFGIARQFASLAEPNGIRVMPFYDSDEADRWLDGVRGSTASAGGADRTAQ